MDRKEAINYLNRKGKLDKPFKERAFSEEEEAEIKEVQKSGKIYGDPLVILDD